MNRNIKSKYSHDDRKYIAQQIENLKNDEHYTAIFEILTSDDSNSYYHNSNGVFMNLSEMSNKTLSKIKRYLDKIKKSEKDYEADYDVIPNTGSMISNKPHKLSNYEKNIIKQRDLKKVLNEEDDYQELVFDTKKGAKKETKKVATNKRNIKLSKN